MTPSFVPIHEREVVPCPPSMLAAARDVLARRLEAMLTELAAVRHRALEVGEPILAARIGAVAPTVNDILIEHKENPR